MKIIFKILFSIISLIALFIIVHDVFVNLIPKIQQGTTFFNIVKEYAIEIFDFGKKTIVK